jgi:hypothetical protein
MGHGLGHLGNGNHSADFRQAIFHLRENRAVIAPKTFSTADRLQKEQSQQVALGQSPSARTKSNVTAAVTAVKFLELLQEAGIGGVVCHTAPLG